MVLMTVGGLLLPLFPPSENLLSLFLGGGGGGGALLEIELAPLLA